MYFSLNTIDQLRTQYYQLLKRHILLYGYGCTVHIYSHSEHRMVRAIRLHSGESDILARDLERYIPALSGKAIATFQIAEETQRAAIIPKDMMSGEAFLTVVTPTDCLILGFKGGDPTTNHQVLEEMLRVIADSADGFVTYLEPPLQFNPAAIMAAAI